MHRLISPFSKPNIQFATVMAHHSSANLSYFCLLLDNDQVSQQAIFIINLLVDKFVQPFALSLSLLHCHCPSNHLCQEAVKDTWAAGLCLQHTLTLLPLFLPPPAHCEVEALQGKTIPCLCCITHPTSSSPIVLKHHQSPTDSVGVVTTDQDQPTNQLPFANKKK